MNVYVFLITWYIFLCGLYYFLHNKYDNKNVNKIFLILLFIPCSIIMGVRSSNVGVDTWNYERMFYYFSTLSWREICSSFYTDGIEMGFVLLNKLCSLIVDDYFFFQFVFSSVFCMLMALFIYNNSSNVLMSSIIFLGSGLYLTGFNIFRQMLAVAILANSINLLLKGEWKKVVLLVIIATFIHTSSIVFLLVILLYIFRRHVSFLKIILFISLFFAFDWHLVLSLTEHVAPESYMKYTTNTQDAMNAGFVRILWFIVLVFSFVVVYKKSFLLWQKVIAVSCVVYVCSFWIGLNFNFFERLGLYFQPFIILLFDGIEEKVKPLTLRRLYSFFFIVCFTISFILSSRSDQYIYSFFF